MGVLELSRRRMVELRILRGRRGGNGRRFVRGEEKRRKGEEEKSREERRNAGFD